MLPRALRPSAGIIMAKYGLTKRQYYYWLRHPEILRVKRILTKRYFQNDIPDILQAMRDEAIAGDTHAAKLFIEYVDEWAKIEDDNREIRKEVLTKAAVNEMLEDFRNKKV